MGRIEKSFEIRFRTLLVKVNARRLEQGVQRLMESAAKRARAEGVPAAEALLDLYSGMVTKPRFQTRFQITDPVRFVCDCGLGGLARWLRAAGYEAWWNNPEQDEALVGRALETRAILVTTDSLLMERRMVRTGAVRALWLPPLFDPREQLRRTLRHLNLLLREPRCMACGGQLVPVGKEQVQARVPPRTYRWKDEYFACSGCDQLYWHGTHWERIRAELRRVAV